MKLLKAALVVVFGACARMGDEQLMKPTVESDQGKVVEMPTLAQATLRAKSGSSVSGVARFAVDRGVVTMDLMLTDMPPGTHAVHLDENGDCGGTEAEMTGGHWNPTSSPGHGRFDAPPFHLGDIGNVVAGSDGRASLVFATEEWSVGTERANDVIDKAIVIEEGKDDFLTQPDGAAGRHIACGTIELKAGLPTALRSN